MILNDRGATVVDLEAVGAFRIDPDGRDKLYVIVDGSSLTCAYDDTDAMHDDYARIFAAKFGEDGIDE